MPLSNQRHVFSALFCGIFWLKLVHWSVVCTVYNKNIRRCVIQVVSKEPTWNIYKVNTVGIPRKTLSKFAPFFASAFFWRACVSETQLCQTVSALEKKMRPVYFVPLYEYMLVTSSSRRTYSAALWLTVHRVQCHNSDNYWRVGERKVAHLK